MHPRSKAGLVTSPGQANRLIAGPPAPDARPRPRTSRHQTRPPHAASMGCWAGGRGLQGGAGRPSHWRSGSQAGTPLTAEHQGGCCADEAEEGGGGVLGHGCLANRKGWPRGGVGKRGRAMASKLWAAGSGDGELVAGCDLRGTRRRLDRWRARPSGPYLRKHELPGVAGAGAAIWRARGGPAADRGAADPARGPPAATPVSLASPAGLRHTSIRAWISSLPAAAHCPVRQAAQGREAGGAAAAARARGGAPHHHSSPSSARVHGGRHSAADRVCCWALLTPRPPPLHVVGVSTRPSSQPGVPAATSGRARRPAGRSCRAPGHPVGRPVLRGWCARPPAHRPCLMPIRQCRMPCACVPPAVPVPAACVWPCRPCAPCVLWPAALWCVPGAVPRVAPVDSFVLCPPPRVPAAYRVTPAGWVVVVEGGGGETRSASAAAEHTSSARPPQHAPGAPRVRASCPKPDRSMCHGYSSCHHGCHGLQGVQLSSSFNQTPRQRLAWPHGCTQWRPASRCAWPCWLCTLPVRKSCSSTS